MTITEGNFSQDAPLILVVDDDRSTRTLLKVAMEEEGYRVITAKDGEECLNEYHRSQPNMILLDAVMPEMDGFTCCKRLGQLSQGHSIPILMITALDDQDSINQAFAAGAVDYITKPIHWAVLAQRVKRLLTTSKTILQLEELQREFIAQEKWLKLFATISQVVSGSFVLESFLKDLGDKICLCFQVQGVGVYQKDGPLKIESALSGFFVNNNNIATEIFSLESFYKTHYQQGRVIVIEDLQTRTDLPETAIASLLNHQVRSLMILPILHSQTLWGVWCAYFCFMPHSWKSWEIEQLQTLANLLALAVSRSDSNS